ncbi:alpha/beta fold hydrolase [Micromonospora sp. AP08]|uniref:alpha/beta fold hydrolase n=1 Tax=Micromonospora sp. AP08 TaxID=2604467 RepID=UPI0011D7046D|nr:alpha/beta fold hydrolase [Micromonospora sp. AP08]TYB39241.1 alpha/beta fold hydrolase [Micromonospora sp. AP08]
MGLLARVLRAALTPRSLNRSQTLVVAERLSAATHLVASLELLARGEDRKPGGVNDWSISRQNIRHRGVTAQRFFDVVSGPRASAALHVARAASAAFLLAPTDRWRKGRLIANAVVAGTSIGTFPGQLYGTDGSDQASFLVQAAATVARSSRQPRVADAALWFLGLQSTLNYTASGWVKMVSPTWRSGRALPGVMRTVTYGHQGAWQLAERFPRSAKTVGHAVLAMECLFPVVLATRGRLAPAFVGSAAAFHLANAGLMGLGRFVGAFCAMHPALLYVTDPRRRSPGAAGESPRNDAFPAVAGALAAATLTGAVVAQARRGREVRRGHPGQRRIETRAGNVLAYLPENLGQDGPVIFFESALAATDLHWDWLRRVLSPRFPTVVYQRAGYGASEYRGARPFTLASAAEDFVDLVGHVAADRPVVIVGHSLGGYIAMRSGELLGDRVLGVVLVDSSHPGELDRSPRQAGGAAMLDSTLRLMAPSMRLGLGPLLQVPQSFGHLPADVRQPALTQYRDARLWSAAHREWQATRADFAAFDGQLPKLRARVLVLSAGSTLKDDPVQADLHRELGQAGSGATHQVVDGADHDTIITREDFANQTADHIRAFVLNVTGGRREGSDR